MLLKDVWIDAPHRHRRLTLLRLVDPEGRTLPYRLMSEALGAGTLRIGEVDGRGAAQSQVWEGVADFSRRTGVRSDTGALDDLYARLHRGLVRGYLFEALADEGPAPENRIADQERAWPDWDQARLILDRVAGCHRAGTPPVGRGTYRVLSGPVVGGELTDGTGDVRDGERLVHLSAFPEGR